MKDLGEDYVEAFAARLTVLPFVDELVVRRVVHGSAAEQDSYDQVEVHFKEMNSSTFVQLQASWFLRR